MNDKPHVHELKAEHFILDEWRPIDQLPRDGSVVEVRAHASGPMVRAVWNTKHERLELEPGSNHVDRSKLTQWRYPY